MSDTITSTELGHSPRVLVVDDDANFRRAVGIALRLRGYDVKEAGGGLEAMREVTGSPPDVVLLDWQMPGMDGEQTCRAIRAISQVPVIVVSALDRSEEARAYGVTGSLTKPVDIDTLVADIDSALRQPGV